MKFRLMLADLAQLGERQTEEKTLVKISGGPVFDPQSSQFEKFFLMITHVDVFSINRCSLFQTNDTSQTEHCMFSIVTSQVYLN